MYKFYAYISRSRWIHRAFIAFIGIMPILFGINSYFQDEPGHMNYWGGLVTPETSIGIGVLVLILAFIPSRLWIDRKPKKPRTRKERIAARRAQPQKSKDDFLPGV